MGYLVSKQLDDAAVEDRAVIDNRLAEELIIRIYPYSSSSILLIDELQSVKVYSAVGRTNPP